MEKKRLFRSCDDRVIAGVAGGMADYFDIDPTIVRLLFVLLTVSGGVGLLIYIVAVIVIPEESVPKPTKSETKSSNNEKVYESKHVETKVEKQRESKDNIFGLILLALGLFFLLQNVFPWFRMANLWPIFLILIGLVLLKGTRKE